MAGAKKPTTLPLKSLNHVSRNCRDLYASVDFYEHVLGFVPIKRPGSLSFDGAWLFNYGIGIHLLQAEEKELDFISNVKEEINPRDDHISFQCEDILLVAATLQENGIKSTSRVIEEGGIQVEQLFFHDPDGFMIEICTCEKLPVQPLPPRYPSWNCVAAVVAASPAAALVDEYAFSIQRVHPSNQPVMDRSSTNCAVCA